MELSTAERKSKLPRRLRAYVEVVGRKLLITPIADCDTDELDILRFFNSLLDDSEKMSAKPAGTVALRRGGVPMSP
jgi:hypothetical protein